MIPKRVSKGIVIGILKAAGIPYIAPTAIATGAKILQNRGGISVYWAGLKDMEQVRERLEEVRTALKKGGIKTSWTFADAGDFKIPYLGVDTVSIFVEVA